MPIDVTVTTHGAAALDALAAAVRRGQGRRSAGTRHDRRPQQHRRGHGPSRPRSPWRRGGRRGPHPVPRGRAARPRRPCTAAGRNRCPRPSSTSPSSRSWPTRPAGTGPSATTRRPWSRCRDVSRELRIAGPGAIDGPGPHAAGREPARVAAAVARRLAGDWYDEGDLLAGAAAEVPLAACPAASPASIVYLPELAAAARARACSPPSGQWVPWNWSSATCGDGQDDVDRSTAELVERLTGSTARRRTGGARRRGSEGRRDLHHRRRRRSAGGGADGPRQCSHGGCRSTAWPCCGRRTARTPGSSSTTSARPRSRGTGVRAPAPAN